MSNLWSILGSTITTSRMPSQARAISGKNRAGQARMVRMITCSTHPKIPVARPSTATIPPRPSAKPPQHRPRQATRTTTLTTSTAASTTPPSSQDKAAATATAAVITTPRQQQQPRQKSSRNCSFKPPRRQTAAASSPN